MLYELLTGQRPFHADNLMAIFYKITHEEVNFDLVPAGPGYDALLPILRRALAKELDDRYQTAYEFGQDLRDFLKSRAAAGGDTHALEGLLEMDAPGTSPPQLLGESPGVRTRPPAPADGAGHGGHRARFRAAVPAPPPAGRPAPPWSAERRRCARGPGRKRPTSRRRCRARRRAGRRRRASPRAPLRSRSRSRPGRRRSMRWAGVLVAAAALRRLQVPDAGAGRSPRRRRWRRRRPRWPWHHPPTTLAAATPAPPPPTPVPQPTFEAAGRSAAAMRAAQAAFRRGDYDQALAEAQNALKQDPSNADARRLLESALNGQKAAVRVRAAEGALREGDYARGLDGGGSGAGAGALGRRRHRPARAASGARSSARRRKRSSARARDAAARREGGAGGSGRRWRAASNKLLAQGDSALAAQDYDGAIAALRRGAGGRSQQPARGAGPHRRHHRARDRAGPGRGGGAAGRPRVRAREDRRHQRGDARGQRAARLRELAGGDGQAGRRRRRTCPAASCFEVSPEAVKAGRPVHGQDLLPQRGPGPDPDPRDGRGHEDQQPRRAGPGAAAGQRRRPPAARAAARAAGPLEGGHDLLVDGGRRAHDARRDATATR